MMLTRLSLRTDDMKQLRITDCYSLHRVVYSCFPLGGDTLARGEDAGFLYADEGIAQGIRRIVILSETTPQPLPCGTMEHHDIPLHWLEHGTYRFKVTLNPVRRNNKSGVLMPVKGHEAIKMWFCDKAVTWGMEVNPAECHLDESGVWQFIKKEQPVTLAYARISGVFHVHDSALFHKAFRRGLGRAKAFGCGLLQLIPVSDSHKR